MSTLVRGDTLPREARQEVLRSFIYRWTSDNPRRVQAWTAYKGKCPSCDIRTPAGNTSSAEGHTHPTVRMTTDAQWLADHAFWVTKAGRLDQRRRHAEPASLIGEP